MCLRQIFCLMGLAAPARCQAWALHGLLALAMLLIGIAPARAATYTFPGALPPGCSGSGPSYSCTGGGSLSYGDVIVINAPKPATITFTGNINTNTVQINTAGSASDLSLVVNGTLTIGDSSVIKANITATSITTTGANASITGNLTATGGDVNLSYGSSVAGTVSASGSVLIGQNNTITGNATASGSQVSVGYAARLTGHIIVGGATTVTLAQDALVTGTVTSATGAVSLGYAARVTGNLSTSSGRIDLAQNAAAQACVSSSSSAVIALQVSSSVSKVCCGTAGSCSTSCVSNGSGAAMPAVCPSANATLVAKYDLVEATYNGTAGELKDTAGYSGGPYNGKAKGSPMPAPATASPARTGSPGTCGYASLPGPDNNGGGFTITGLPVSTTAGNQTTVAFWMYWDGGDWVMPVGFNQYDLVLGSDLFGFNTSNGDIYGISSTGLANGWHHVVAVFTNGGVGNNQLWVDGVQKVLSQRINTPLNSYAVVSGTLQVGGWTADTGYRFSGRIDQLRVYQGAATASQVATLYAETATCPTSTTELARYDFKEAFYAGTTGELKDTAGHASGPFNGKAQGTPMPTTTSASPARSGSPGTCRHASLPGPLAGGGAFVVTGLPVSTSTGAKTSVAFWMYWDGVTDGTPMGWNIFNLWFVGGNFGFNTANGSDIYGIASTGLGGGWHHVVAVFSNGGVTGGKLYIDGVLQSLTQRAGSPINANAVVTGTLTIGGWGNDTTDRFIGKLDQVRVYSGEIDSTLVTTLYNETASCNATEVARYNFDEASYAGTAGELKDSTGYTGGPFNGAAQGSPLPTPLGTSPARSGSPGTCAYASLPGPRDGGGSFVVTGLPVSTSTGVQTTVSFWMYWKGGNSEIPLSFDSYDLWLYGGGFGFNTTNSDIHGIASTGLANAWRHVVAVFTNGSVTANELWIDGVQQTLTQRLGTPTASRAVVSGKLQFGAYGWGGSTSLRFNGLLDQVRVFNGGVTAAQVATLYAETPSTCVPPLHHLEIQHASGTGLTCTPSTVTVKACQDAACTSLYTGGLSGTLSATGGSVVWPATAAFSIASGSSSTTVNLQSITTTPTLLGVASSTPAAGSAATCNFGSPSCTFTAADAGFIFDVLNHVSEVSQTVSVRAVRKSDSATVCTPAFASTSKNVGFSCGYSNPTSGTLAVRVGGVALNNANNAAAACDGNLQPVSLAFNASGIASTTVQYADAGRMLLSAQYTGSGSDAGLVMAGSDFFIAAPDSLAVTGITAGPIKAGSSFSATFSARNSANAITPNYGRESPAEGTALGWVRIQPSGTAYGSFSGSLGSFANGEATASNLAWTEVGRGDLLVRNTTANGYLNGGTHLRVFGASAGTGARFCALENANCVIPGGTTATVYYGENGFYAAKTAQTGTVACNNTVFGDPKPGTPKKCYYVATSATNGSVGDFIPHRFTVAASHACGSFSYAGQPITTTVTARNAAGNVTVNFNGTTTTTPTFAQAVTLTDANGLAVGTLSGGSIAASAFSAGVASAQPSYAFTNKATAPQSLVLRATNGASGAALVSSEGYTEPTLPLRSGRLRLANAFGKATAGLQLSAAVDYWVSTGWRLNSADSCTTVAGASVALSNPRDATGAASATTTSAGALAITAGSGSISLAAPTPAGRSLTLDVAVNLGSTGTDQSCHASHPATTGAGKPWLRAQNGNCSATADRDPAARASFGIFSPESRKTVHVRDLF